MFDFTSLRCRAAWPALLAAAVAGCAYPGSNTAQDRGQSSGGAGMTSGQAAGSGRMDGHKMDMGAMCADYQAMQNAPETERQAMMAKRMPDMSPEMRARHMEMMREHCR